MLTSNTDSKTPARSSQDSLTRTLIALGIFALLALTAGETELIAPRTALVLLALTTFLALAIAAFPLIWESNMEGGSQARHVRTNPEIISAQSGIWQAAIDAVPESLLILDRDATILHANTSALEFFGKKIHGLPLEYVSRQPELSEAISLAVTTQSKQVVRIIEPAGVQRHLEAAVVPLGNDGEDEPIAILIIISDHTAQQRLIDMRADFIANASHELRTPLAAVRGFIETLQGPARRDDNARDRFLSIMSDQAMRMTRLIDDLLLLSRVEERANIEPLGTVELNETLAHVVEVLRPLADAKSVSIDLQKFPGRATVIGDRDELVQVFVNLIENAIKYGYNGMTVSVQTTALPANGGTPDAYKVLVIDNGPGIAPEHLPRLTERFYRVSPKLSREIGGTGLGLAIVKHVLNRHHGKLDISSKIAAGSTFSVTLNSRKT